MHCRFSTRLTRRRQTADNIPAGIYDKNQGTNNCWCLDSFIVTFRFVVSCHGSPAKSRGAVYQCIKFTTILTPLKLFPLALCVNKFTHTRLLAIFNGSSIENYYSTRQFIAKGNSPPRAEGQRWEAQRAAEQCLETGGMMFERSEFLPPQALRQAASGEVCTD